MTNRVKLINVSKHTSVLSTEMAGLSEDIADLQEQLAGFVNAIKKVDEDKEEAKEKCAAETQDAKDQIAGYDEALEILQEYFISANASLIQESNGNQGEASLIQGSGEESESGPGKSSIPGVSLLQLEEDRKTCWSPFVEAMGPIQSSLLGVGAQLGADHIPIGLLYNEHKTQKCYLSGADNRTFLNGGKPLKGSITGSVDKEMAEKAEMAEQCFNLTKANDNCGDYFEIGKPPGTPATGAKSRQRWCWCVNKGEVCQVDKFIDGAGLPADGVARAIGTRLYEIKDCDAQREALQEHFSDAVNLLRKLSADTETSMGDEKVACEKVADEDAKLAKAPLKEKKDEVSEEILKKKKELDAAETNSKILQSKVAVLKPEVEKLEEECKQVAKVKPALRNVEILITHLQDCPPSKSGWQLQMPDAA
jgi:hypothetical protein